MVASSEGPDDRARVVLVQLADLHIGADWVTSDPLRTLSVTVDAVRDLGTRVDAVLVLGDVAEHGIDAEYAAARVELERLGAPIHVAMGNRDEPESMNRHFDLGAATGGRRHVVTELGPMRLVVLDTSTPTGDGGSLPHDSITWLERRLAEAPDRPTLLAMHHPPVLTGCRAWDRIALEDEAQAALGEVLRRNLQVRRIIGAHLHRSLTTVFAGRPVVVGPSTYVQFQLNPDGTELEPTGEPPGYVAHLIARDGSVLSLTQAARAAG